jgi:hypothetical protein
MAGKKKPEVTPVTVVTTPEIKLPVVKPVKLARAFYIEKTNGVWKLVTADVDGDKLVNKQVKECDNKALSLENFKITFARHYYFGA